MDWDSRHHVRALCARISLHIIVAFKGNMTGYDGIIIWPLKRASRAPRACTRLATENKDRQCCDAARRPALRWLFNIGGSSIRCVLCVCASRVRFQVHARPFDGFLFANQTLRQVFIPPTIRSVERAPRAHAAPFKRFN